MPAKWKYGLQGFYGTLKSMSIAFMDSMSMATVQTLCLQQMRREAAIESVPKALLLQRQRESFVLLHVPLSYCLTGRLVPFTRRMWLRSTKSLSKRPLLIRLSLTRLLLLLQESLGLNLARIRLSLRRLLLIRLTSLTLVFFRSSDLIYFSIISSNWCSNVYHYFSEQI